MAEGWRAPERSATGRLILSRPGGPEAAAIFAGWAADRDVTRWLGWRPHGDVGETRAFLRRCDEGWETGRSFALTIALRDAPGHPVGMIHPRMERGAAEFGYVFAKRVWGRGLATEALSHLVGLALSHPSVWRAQAFCDAEHAASARVMAKVGMRREGVLRRWFVHPALSPEPRDCVMFARTL